MTEFQTSSRVKRFLVFFIIDVAWLLLLFLGVLENQIWILANFIQCPTELHIHIPLFYGGRKSLQSKLKSQQIGFLLGRDAWCWGALKSKTWSQLAGWTSSVRVS